ncbi:hypothetical protein OG21DRAFT_1421859 [Imleria badia]|nr:hypothetical protein OG21DRAFT_1421859 [Imleria badia]
MNLPPPSTPPTPKNTMTSKELHLGVPDIFDSNEDEYHSWISSIQLYLLINETIYDTDEKQIMFVLSFMKKGTAQGWATTFTADAIQLKKFGTFDNFIKSIETTFCTTDIKGKALGILQSLNQDGDDILGFINQFKVAAHHSGITDASVLTHPLLLQRVEPRTHETHLYHGYHT